VQNTHIFSSDIHPVGVKLYLIAVFIRILQITNDVNIFPRAADHLDIFFGEMSV
jgi:hypothetical protein